MDYLIYLAGPITGLDWKSATEWRKDLIERFKDASTGKINYIGLSPLRDKEYYLEKEDNIKDRYDEYKMSTAKAITDRNINDVRRSNLVIVNFIDAKKISIGTVLEIGAAKALNIPIILIMEDEKQEEFFNESVSITELNSSVNVKYLSEFKNVHDHFMIRESSSIIASNIDEAFHFAIHLLGN